MATYTENYNLLMTEREDNFNIADYNENFEAIDTLMAENESAANEINEKLGTPEEGETVFSLLKNSGSSAVKSIQHYILNETSNSNVTETIPINTVDPTRCIVIIERLSDDTTAGISKTTYTLNETSLVVTRVYSHKSITGFWIIEFN